MAVGDIVRSGEGRLLEKDPKAFWRGPDARDNDPLHEKRDKKAAAPKKKPKIDYDAPLERVSEHRERKQR